MSLSSNERASTIIARKLETNRARDRKLTPLITDFGTATFTLGGGSGSGSIRALESLPPVGTFNYVDPDVLTCSAVAATPACDIFSFAIVMLEAVLGVQARKIGTKKNKLHELHAKGKRFDIPNGVEKRYPGYVDLLKQCWAEDRTKRTSFDKVVDILPLVILEDCEPDPMSPGRVSGRLVGSRSGVLPVFGNGKGGVRDTMFASLKVPASSSSGKERKGKRKGMGKSKG